MRLALRLAWRDLRAGGRALWLLALCLFLGTVALAGIGSLTASMLAALHGQARQALGGDLELRVSQRRATAEELAAFAAQGRVAEVVTLRAMAQVAGKPPVLVDLKAVDASWPLVGRFRMQPAGGLATGRIALAPALVVRLGLRPGGSVQIGVAHLRVAGTIAEEPDQLGAGLRFGLPAIVSTATLDATGLIQPGSLYEARYRIRLDRPVPARAVGERLRRLFAGAGWTVRLPDEATRGLDRTVAELGQFLALVGLAALTIAGIGVGSGVGAYLEAKTRSIAILKVLGASSRLIAGIFVAELLAVGALAIGAGLALGAALPWIVRAAAGDALPVAPVIALFPRPLAVAAALGLLVTLLFALPPLARARVVPAGSLLRDALAAPSRVGGGAVAGVVLLAAAIVALAIGSAADHRLAAGFVGGVMLLLAVLGLLGLFVRWGVARVPRPRRPLARLAIANLHRPAAQTGRLIVALGLGTCLFVALAAIDTSLAAELRSAAPTKAPRFFAIDLPPGDAATFAAAVRRASPGTAIQSAPSLRGQVTAIRGVAIADMRPPPTSWVLRGDRTLTWSATVPPHNRVIAGRWWPPGYRGAPLVSIGDDMAKALGLRVGDAITISVLGVDVPARIAAIRQIDWSALGLNFAIIFSPGYVEEAPHSLLASVYSAPDRDAAVAGAVAQALPGVTLVRVGDVIGQVSDVLGRIILAIRWAAGVTVAAGIVVLTGALTAAARARRYDTVVLKLLGATRRQVLLVQAMEYGLLACLVATVAAGLGLAAAWGVMRFLLERPFAPSLPAIALTLAATAIVTIGVALLSSLPLLRLRAAEGLRSS